MKDPGIARRMWALVFAACCPWTLTAAEEVGKKPVTFTVTLERFPPDSSHSLTLPNGKKFGGGGWAR